MSSKVRVLLSHRVSATSRANMLRHPLHVIAAQDLAEDDDLYEASLDITESLLSYAPEVVEIEDINGDTPLDVAADVERCVHACLTLRDGHCKDSSSTLANFFSKDLQAPLISGTFSTKA